MTSRSTASTIPYLRCRRLGPPGACGGRDNTYTISRSHQVLLYPLVESWKSFRPKLYSVRVRVRLGLHSIFPIGITSEGSEVTQKCPRSQSRASIKKLLSTSRKEDRSPRFARLRNAFSAWPLKSPCDNVSILRSIIVALLRCAIPTDNIRVASIHIELTLISCPIL